jgi:hypothetical protein
MTFTIMFVMSVCCRFPTPLIDRPTPAIEPRIFASGLLFACRRRSSSAASFPNRIFIGSFRRTGPTLIAVEFSSLCVDDDASAAEDLFLVNRIATASRDGRDGRDGGRAAVNDDDRLRKGNCAGDSANAARRRGEDALDDENAEEKSGKITDDE